MTLLKNQFYSIADSVTRLGEISHFCLILTVFGNFFEGLFSIRQNFEPPLANFKSLLGKCSLL